MKKSLFISLIFIFAMFGTCFFNNLNLQNVYAKIDENINYVALGDSIADGYALDNYEGYTFNTNSYTERIKNQLEIKYSTCYVLSNTYAKEGDDTYDLLSLLNEKNTTAINAIKNADIITICIGANDILGLALKNVSDYIVNEVTIADMENILSNGIENFKSNFPLILQKLNNLNSNAKVIFNTIYNPYKCFKLSTLLENLAPIVGINVENVNKMGDITEIYLAGGINSQGKMIDGLNPLLSNFINNSENENFLLVDVKAAFDNYLQINGSTNYSKIVNVNSSEISFSNFNKFSEYADPHPTVEGHELIFETIWEELSNKISLVNYNTCGGTFENNITSLLYFENNNEKLIQPEVPTKSNYKFKGWYTNPEGGQKWDFSNEITSDVVLYAQWEEIIYHNVNFNLNGGIGNIDSQQVLDGECLLEPNNPTKENYNFVGWYTSLNNGTLWDFSNNVVTEDITLYAVWEEKTLVNTAAIVITSILVLSVIISLSLAVFIKWCKNHLI